MHAWALKKENTRSSIALRFLSTLIHLTLLLLKTVNLFLFQWKLTVLVTMAVWGGSLKKELWVLGGCSLPRLHFKETCKGECRVWVSGRLGLKGPWVPMLTNSANLTVPEHGNFYPKKWYVIMVPSLDFSFSALQTSCALTRNASLRTSWSTSNLERVWRFGRKIKNRK